MPGEEIEVIIELDGTVKIDAINFKGKACHDVLSKLRTKLGRKIKEKKKPEYYREPVRERQRDKI